MTANEAIAAIKQFLPDGKFGMAEKDNGQFEVWVRSKSGAGGFKSGTSIDDAFTQLYHYCVSRISQSDPGGVVVFPKEVHLPEWMNEEFAARTLAERDAIRQSARLYALTKGKVNCKYTVISLNYEEHHSEYMTWCWRHLRKCHKVSIGWALRESYPLKQQEVAG